MVPEVAAALGALDITPRQVRALPSLTPSARSFRVETADGRSVKVVRASSEPRATVIERALTELALPALPRFHGRHGRVLVLDWLEGQAADASVAADVAGLLATIHAGSPEGLATEPRLVPAAVAARALDELDALAVAGLVDRPSSSRLSRLLADPPGEGRPVFLHSDMHPDNLIVDPSGLRIIDNGSWSIGSAAYDLARTLWRWPMAQAARPAWLARYGAALGRAPERDVLGFWLAAAAIGSTAYRVAAGAPLPPQTRERLVALAP